MVLKLLLILLNSFMKRKFIKYKGDNSFNKGGYWFSKNPGGGSPIDKQRLYFPSNNEKLLLYMKNGRENGIQITIKS